MKKEFKSVLVICIANPSKNPRPNRIIKLLLRMGYEVDTCSYKSNGDLNISNEYIFEEINSNFFERINRLLFKIIRLIIPSLDIKILLTEKIYKFDKIKLELENYDLVIVENIEMLPFAVKNNSKKIICDLREFYPLEYENSFLFRLLESKFKIDICKKYLKKCDKLITVSTGLINGYQKYFNLTPKLLMSTPNYFEISVKVNDGKNIKMVHHGVANTDRKLENMIEMFKYLDNRFSLDFYLVGNQTYTNQLKKLAKSFPKIRFLEPVPFNDIIPTMNQYDIGLYLLEPTGFNTEYALPNKFFEYIQARLMLAIGPSYDMKKIVEQYNLGIVSKNFDSKELAIELNKLSYEDILIYKENSNIASKELCYENESKKLTAILDKLLKK
ncbi:glycosyltransferase family protein [Aliarcobacter cryaerophilus]|uniref:hypothetical protein n=1 Tax=Aliarcobacter cryaerophilus TaxID=28198 RepID=UPI0021B5CF0C|nr:hypothetical protein [Aliarcobacter cryaerophilus]MCT7473089.1 hypothetical protein [Aliarcobacter cryaerophilus]